MDSVKVENATISSAVTSSIVPPSLVIEESKTIELLSLEQLVKVGKIEEEVKIASFTFKLVTLSSVENTEVVSITSNIKADELRFNTLRLELLARVIVSVNGVPFESLYQGSEETSKIKKREHILKLLQQTVINSLWDAYDKMITKSIEITKVEGTALKN